MAIVSVQGVTKQFGAQVILDDLSLTLHHGENVGLIGANGAGKTTLFRIIAQELAPDMGRVETSRNLGVGYLKQEPDEKHIKHCSAFAESGNIYSCIQHSHEIQLWQKRGQVCP